MPSSRGSVGLIAAANVGESVPTPPVPNGDISMGGGGCGCGGGANASRKGG